MVAFMSVWAIVATMMLAFFAHRYYFVVVTDFRSRYSLDAAAARALAEAAAVLRSALATRDSLHSAVRSGLFRDPSDYSTLERVLAPAFLAAPAVQSVELAFSDRTASLLVKKTQGTGEKQDILMQSDAPDCFRLGIEACVDGAGARAGPAGEALNEDSEEYTAIGIVSDPGGVFRWLSGVDFVPYREVSLSTITLSNNFDNTTYTSVKEVIDTTWLPVYRLAFRTNFTGEDAQTVARASAEFARNSGTRRRVIDIVNPPAPPIIIEVTTTADPFLPAQQVTQLPLRKTRLPAAILSKLPLAFL